MDYQNKYLKYKMKYIQLKEELISQGYDVDDLMMGEVKTINSLTLDNLMQISKEINSCNDKKCKKPGMKADGTPGKDFNKKLKKRVEDLFKDTTVRMIITESTINTLILLNVFCEVPADTIYDYYMKGQNQNNFIGKEKSKIYLRIIKDVTDGEESFSFIGMIIKKKGIEHYMETPLCKLVRDKPCKK